MGTDLTEAGAPVAGEGHLHVAVDEDCVADGETIPGERASGAGFYHFGDGSDAREIELTPGTYTLCMQLGDGEHRAFGATETITITVE